MSSNFDVSTYEQMGTESLIGLLIGLVIGIVCMWKIFTKAGRAGWKCIIPIYNTYNEFEIAGMNGWMFLLLLIPIVDIVIYIMLIFKFAKAFGKSTAFGFGLLFLTPIFLLILAFDSSTYVGNN